MSKNILKIEFAKLKRSIWWGQLNDPVALSTFKRVCRDLAIDRPPNRRYIDTSTRGEES
jgi:hypothetical protein